MRPDDFYRDEPALGWTNTATRVLDIDLFAALRRGPVAGRDDLDVALGLARLVHDDLERYGTDGTQEMTEQQIREAILALRAVVARLAVPAFDVPFRDYATFRSYWIKNNARNSWQARRVILGGLFDPLHARLIDLEARSSNSTLAQPVSPHRVTGWARVDAELAEIRRHFQNAQTEQDYRNVGNDCVIALETLSAQVYDPAVHLRPGETEPPVANTKIRLDRYVEDGLPGPHNADLRKLTRAAIEFAQHVKHTPTGTRRDAGIAADAVILLANLLRRIAELPII